VAHAALTALHGVGPWTADIYLLFCLGHADAFPSGDLAVQEAARIALRLNKRPDAKQLTKIAEIWRPWRGVAAHLLWAYYHAVKKRAVVPVQPASPAKQKAKKKAKKPGKPVTIVSYDEKPGIQAIATTAPDLPPVPGTYATFARDYEYKRHGTLSLLAGIDLLTGKVHALVKERHRSREFIEFLKLLDAAYPASTAIKLILDNHSAHISRETQAWLAAQPAGRFEFTFTPKHGSWLNLIEGFFSKFARSVLRHIRVASKQELKERIMAGIEDVNRYPVIHTWSYKLAQAA